MGCSPSKNPEKVVKSVPPIVKNETTAIKKPVEGPYAEYSNDVVQKINEIKKQLGSGLKEAELVIPNNYLAKESMTVIEQKKL